jgi:structural maintenance of chromosome 2
MAYVFGDTIICADSESAKAVTFNKAVGVKSVTLDGDVYDPSGMLSGGSAPSGNGMLIKVQELNRKEAELNEAKDLLRQLDSKEAKERAGRDGWKKMGRELEIKEHELGLLEEQIGGSNAARVC